MRLLKHKGLSFVEIIVGFALTALIAVIVAPKIMSPVSTGHEYNIDKIEQILQDVNTSVLIRKKLIGDPVVDSTNPLIRSSPPSWDGYNHISDLEWSIKEYGHYMGIKELQRTPTYYSYFLFHDGSRVTPNPEIFRSGSYLSEYGTNPLPNNQWRQIGSSGSQYCGNYPAHECFYMDINGKDGPNRHGKDGDWIPFRIDPINGTVTTLYQAQRISNPTAPASQLCRFVSVYDVKKDYPGARACP